jgi:protein arginine kinase activator
MKERGEKPLGLAVGPLGNEIVFEESGISQFTADQLKTVEELKCPSCGTDHHEVSVNGLFGCEQCYSTFSHLLEIAEEQIDDSIKRKGDLQGTFNDTVAIGKIEVLKRQMDYAVQTENYERAAIFRDQIEELSKKMGEDE